MSTTVTILPATENVEIEITGGDDVQLVTVQPATENVAIEITADAFINLTQQGMTDVFTAGQDLSGGRVVYISEGKAYYFDPSNELLAGFVLGITGNAALEDDTVLVQFNGIFTESGLGLTPDTKYYIGANGSLTTNISGLKIIQQAGVSLSADKLAINFYSPIITN